MGAGLLAGTGRAGQGGSMSNRTGDFTCGVFNREANCMRRVLEFAISALVWGGYRILGDQHGSVRRNILSLKRRSAVEGLDRGGLAGHDELGGNKRASVSWDGATLATLGHMLHEGAGCLSHCHCYITLLER